MRSLGYLRLLSVLIIVGTALTACSTPLPQIIKETVVVTKETEKEVLVTQKVVVTVEVEKIVEVTPTPLDPVVVSITDAAGADDAAGILRQKWLLEGFRRIRPDVVLNLTPYRYDPQTFDARAQGALEDAFTVWLSDARALIEGGYAANMTALVEDFPHLGAYHPAILALAQDGYSNVYGLPHDAHGIGLLYNRRLFEEAGLDPDKPPQTWDEMREVARQIQAKLDGVDGFNIRNQDGMGGWMIVAMMYSFGGETETLVNGTWTAAYNNNAMVAAMQLMHDLRWIDGTTTSDITAWDNFALILDFVEGRVAMTLAAPDTLQWMVRNLEDFAVDEVGFGRMPDGGANATLGEGSVWLYNPESAPHVKDAAYAYTTWREFDMAAFENAVKTQAEHGELVGLPYLNVFTGEYGQQRAAIIEKYANLPVGNYADYINAGMAVRGDPPVATEKLYAELGQVLRQVLAVPSPDIKAMLDASATRFQVQVLDVINAEKKE